jgi:hypothetical protein
VYANIESTEISIIVIHRKYRRIFGNIFIRKWALIILTDDDRIVNDENEVAETFNEFFVNVAKDIGKDSCAVNQEHPGIKVISEHSYSENKLKFESIDISFVEKQIDKMNVNKATGKDGIAVKI